jgi:hypothetical protein
MHFCNRSTRRRFCPTVRIGDLGLGGGQSGGPCETLCGSDEGDHPFDERSRGSEWMLAHVGALIGSRYRRKPSRSRSTNQSAKVAD